MGAPADVALPIRCRFAAAGTGYPAGLRVAGGTLTPPRPGTWQGPMARRLSLLGGFELRCAGTEVAVARGGQRLLALLALQGRPLERLWVAGTLWLDATEERAGASLRSALWLTGAGRFGAAVQAGLAAVAGEPLRESAHRTLIRAHLAEGNPGEAVRQYHLYRRLLADELAIEPSPAIRGLVQPLLRPGHHPGRGLGRGRRLRRRRGLAAAAPRPPGAVMPR
jgi:Bacterial transcriptional activator domain